MSRALATNVIVDSDDFYRLGEQWDRLVDDCASSTPFQTHAWLTAWWRSYGVAGRLRVVVAYLGDQLVGAAALSLSRQLPVRTLIPVGAGLSDFCDVLVADSVPGRADVVGALGSAVRELNGWDVLDFPEVRPGAAAFELVRHWPGPVACTEASTCLELPVEDVADLVTRLPRQTGKTLRKKLRKLEEVGVVSHLVPAAEVPEAMIEFHRLHLAQWRGRGINPEHTRERFRRFLVDALPPMVERRQAVIIRYLWNGELVGVDVNLLSASMMGAYLGGMSPAMRDHVDVATLLLRGNLQLAQENRKTVLSLFRGLEDYKLRWRPDAVVNQRVTLGRSGSAPALAFLAATRGRARALPWLRQRAPWLKELRDEARRRLSR